MLIQILLIIAVGGLMHAARTFAPGAGAGTSAGTALAIGFFLLTAFFVGKLFAAIRLPRLTGYIVTGLVVGPSLLGLINEGMIADLNLVNGIAIALIALTAGGELNFRAIRPLLRSIILISIIAVVGTMLLLTAVVFAIHPLLGFMDGMTLAQTTVVALVLGVTISAQSPAVVVALRNELSAEGPVARTVLGVVVLSDMVVIVFFAAASSVAKALLGGSAEAGETAVKLAWELFGSLGAGVIVGVLLSLYLAKVKEGTELFLFIVCIVISEVGTRLQFDILLVALSAGVFIQNATAGGKRLIQAIEETSVPVYVLFFAVAGATIHLKVLLIVGIPAAVLILSRAAGFLTGTSIAARLAGAPSAVVRYAGFGLLPQAGLALALAMLFVRTFPSFGEGASALTLGIVGMNEIIAPAFYRWALVRSGEGRPEQTREAAQPAGACKGPPSGAPPPGAAMPPSPTPPAARQS